jgi:mercuric ion transport protein
MSEPLPVGNASTSQSALPLAVGGLAAGLLASACCILPLALALAGVSGAWIGNLTALSPYQPYFIGFAAASIGLGFWRLRRSQAACLPGSLCASPAYRRSIQLILWSAGLLVASAAAVDVLAPLFI